MDTDPQLLGVWYRSHRVLYDFHDDGRYYFGTILNTAVLDRGGQRLVVNGQTSYDRLGGDPAGLVGHWRDGAGGEEVYYRVDGRYLTLLDGDPVGYFGTWILDGTRLDQFEYRGAWTADGATLTTNNHLEWPEGLPYVVSGDVATVGGVTWERTWPE